ncbi:MAG: bifunctional folylpolyglutamate synthase/dihydrofolate synthase [Pseudomonadota bacterium]
MNSFSWETFLEQLGGEKRIHYSLENLFGALKDAGHPEKTVKSLIIAGTNGKGSATLFLSQALKLHGYRVATYLSPHLQHLCERFQEGLVPWSVGRLEGWVRALAPLAEKWKLSYFEFLTLIFFVDSAQTKPDFNILEVGMGGRLDATNVTNPKGIVLTNISWDHADYLGDTLEKILGEKMGVLRSGVPVVSGLREPELRNHLQRECERSQCPLYFTDSVSRKVIQKSWSGQEVVIDGHSFFLKNPSTGALENAVGAYLFLRKLFPEISISTLQAAFKEMKNPGRLEVVQENPRIVLSGDHNVAGIQTLTATLRELSAKNIYVLCGFGPDKDAAQMIEELKPFSRELILTRVPRARGTYNQTYKTLTQYEEDPQKAFEELRQKLKPTDTLLVTGSLYLVGELRGLFRPIDSV